MSNLGRLSLSGLFQKLILKTKNENSKSEVEGTYFWSAATASASKIPIFETNKQIWKYNFKNLQIHEKWYLREAWNLQWTALDDQIRGENWQPDMFNGYILIHWRAKTTAHARTMGSVSM